MKSDGRKLSKQITFTVMKVMAIVACIFGVLGINIISMTNRNRAYDTPLGLASDTTNSTSILNIDKKGNNVSSNFQNVLTGKRNESIYFGKFSSANPDFGYNKSIVPIEWEVLSNNDKKYTDNSSILLFSKHQVGNAPFNTCYSNPNYAYWSTSYLHALLNGGDYYASVSDSTTIPSQIENIDAQNSFYGKLFNTAQQNAIMPMKSYKTKFWGNNPNSNDDPHIYYDTNNMISDGTSSSKYDRALLGKGPGKNAYGDELDRVFDNSPKGDKLFLLDYDDVNNADYGFTKLGGKPYGEIIAEKKGWTWKVGDEGYPAMYDSPNSIINSPDLKWDTTNEPNTSYYWLRLPGRYSSTSSYSLYVYSTGYIYRDPMTSSKGIRPALNLAPDSIVYATAAPEASYTQNDLTDVRNASSTPKYKIFIKTPDYINYNVNKESRPEVKKTSDGITVTKPAGSKATHAVVLLSDRSGNGEVSYQAVGEFGSDGKAKINYERDKINLGKYTMNVLLVDNYLGGNYTESVSGSLSLAQDMVAPTAPTGDKKLIWNGEKQLLIDKPGVIRYPNPIEENLELEYAIGKNDVDEPTEGWTTNIKDSKLMGQEAGDYYVWYRPKAKDPSTNQNQYYGECTTITIERIESTITKEPVLNGHNYVYDSNGHSEIVTDGSSSNGTFYYAVIEGDVAPDDSGDWWLNGEWEPGVPNIQDVNKYHVYWKLKGDKNHKDSEGVHDLGEVNITKKVIDLKDVKWVDSKTKEPYTEAFVYTRYKANGEIQTKKFGVELSGMPEELPVIYKDNTESQVAVYEATYTIDLPEDKLKNYDLQNKPADTFNWEIAQRVFEKPHSTFDGVEYNGNEINIMNYINDSLPQNWQYYYSVRLQDSDENIIKDGKVVNAGRYAAVYTFLDDVGTNAVWAGGSTEPQTDWVIINPKKVTVTGWKNKPPVPVTKAATKYYQVVYLDSDGNVIENLRDGNHYDKPLRATVRVADDYKKNSEHGDNAVIEFAEGAPEYKEFRVFNLDVPPKQIPRPTIQGPSQIEYDGAQHTFAINIKDEYKNMIDYDASQLTQTDAGTYTVTFYLKSDQNIAWEGSNDQIECDLTFTILKKKLTIDTDEQKNTFEYTDNWQNFLPTGYDDIKMDIIGSTRESEVGDYPIEIIIREKYKNNYCFDNGKDSLEMTWHIIKKKITLEREDWDDSGIYPEIINTELSKDAFVYEYTDKSGKVVKKEDMIDDYKYYVNVKLADDYKGSYEFTTDSETRWGFVYKAPAEDVDEEPDIQGTHIRVPVPTLISKKAVEYTGEPIDFKIKNNLEEYMDCTGDNLTQTDHGKYSVTFRLKDIPGQDLEWMGEGDSKREITINFEITQKKLKQPTLPRNEKFEYNNGTPIDITSSLIKFDPEYMHIDGNEKINVGEQVTYISLLDPDNTTWIDGSTDTIEIHWTISKRKVPVKWIENTKEYEVPKLDLTGYVIPPKAIHYEFQDMATGDIIEEGDLVDGGVYTITATMNDFIYQNYEFGSGAASGNTASTFAKMFTFIGSKDDIGGGDEDIDESAQTIKFTKPTMDTRKYEYKGRAQTFRVRNFKSEYMEISGDDLTQTEVGQYSVTISLKYIDGKELMWKDGTTEEITIQFEIVAKKVTRPTNLRGEFYYQGGDLITYMPSHFNKNYMTISDNEVVAPGEYDAIVSLKPNYEWRDGENTTEDIIFHFVVKKAPLTVSWDRSQDKPQLNLINGMTQDDIIYTYTDMNGNEVSADQLVNGQEYKIEAKLTEQASTNYEFKSGMTAKTQFRFGIKEPEKSDPKPVAPPKPPTPEPDPDQGNDNQGGSDNQGDNDNNNGNNNNNGGNNNNSGGNYPPPYYPPYPPQPPINGGGTINGGGNGGGYNPSYPYIPPYYPPYNPSVPGGNVNPTTPSAPAPDVFNPDYDEEGIPVWQLCLLSFGGVGALGGLGGVGHLANKERKKNRKPKEKKVKTVKAKKVNVDKSNNNNVFGNANPYYGFAPLVGLATFGGLTTGTWSIIAIVVAVVCAICLLLFAGKLHFVHQREKRAEDREERAVMYGRYNGDMGRTQRDAFEVPIQPQPQARLEHEMQDRMMSLMQEQVKLVCSTVSVMDNMTKCMVSPGAAQQQYRPRPTTAPSPSQPKQEVHEESWHCEPDNEHESEDPILSKSYNTVVIHVNPEKYSEPEIIEEDEEEESPKARQSEHVEPIVVQPEPVVAKVVVQPGVVEVDPVVVKETPQAPIVVEDFEALDDDWASDFDNQYWGEDEETQENAEDNTPVDLGLNQESLAKILSNPANFRIRLKLTTNSTRELYVQLKNAFRAYKNLAGRVSASLEKIACNGKVIAIIGVAQKSLKLWLALDPKEYDYNTYFHMDYSNSKAFGHVPMLVRIASQKSLDRAIELLDILLAKCGVEKRIKPQMDRDIQELIFTLPGNKLLKDKIKRLLLRQSVLASEADILTKEDAKVCLESTVIAAIDGENFDKVSLDEIDQNYYDGQTVDLASLKEKGLVDAECNGFVVASGSKLSKPLLVEANDFSVSAIKMIAIVGGRAIRLTY